MAMTSSYSICSCTAACVIWSCQTNATRNMVWQCFKTTCPANSIFVYIG